MLEMIRMNLVFGLILGSLLQSFTQAQDEKDEKSKCNSNAMVVAMSACQASRHKLSLASQSNDTVKLCGALQRYSYCMAPRLDGCKGATRMAFDVIRAKYASHYHCHLVTQQGTPVRLDVGSESPLLHQIPTRNDYLTPQQTMFHNPSLGNELDENLNNNKTSTKTTTRTIVDENPAQTKASRKTTKLVKISNAVGVKPTKPVTATINKTTTINTTVTTSTTASFNLSTTVFNPHEFNSTNRDVHFNTTTNVAMDRNKAHHLPGPNLITTASSYSNITIIIFDPANTNGCTCLQHVTHSIVLLVASTYCSSLL